jgi:hypothetical protein
MFQGVCVMRRDSGDRRGGAGLVILIALVLIAVA